MRARQRHLKPKSIGAFIALDSRYINQSDNTAISQWNDISGSGNNATQATGANQPTFQTAELGGNGVVRFDGTNDFLESPTITKNQPYTVFVISLPKVFRFGTLNSFFESNNLACNPYIGTTGGQQKLALYAGQDLFHGAVQGLNVWFLLAGVFNTTNSSITVNGAGKVTGNPGSTNLNGKFQIARAWNGGAYYDNDTAFAMACEGAFSDSLRKRCQNSAAYSFKIACS